MAGSWVLIGWTPRGAERDKSQAALSHWRRRRVSMRMMHPARVFAIGVLGAWALALTSSLAAVPEPPLRDKFFVSGGIRIHYVESGHGAPIVLIHGLAGSVERHWLNSGILAGLAADHRVIALDLRGHGRSGKPHDPRAYGKEMSRDVIRLLDHLQIQRAD